MKLKTFLLLLSALLMPVALRAQTATPSSPPAAPAQTAPPTTAGSKLEDDPAFKKLPPDEQAWVKDITDRLHKAIAAKDSGAIDQIQKEIAQHNAKNIPAGCVAAAPKRPSFLDKLKQHAQNMALNQAGKADAKIAQKSGGNLDAGAKDATATAIANANQPKPCPPGTAPAQAAPKQ